MIEMSGALRIFLVVVMLCHCLCMLGGMIFACIITPVSDPEYVHLVLPVRTSATAN